MTKIESAIEALKSGLQGRVILPGDGDYDTARAVMYGGLARHPGVIVRVKSAADVQRAVNAARDTGVELAIRGGGHSNAGHSTTEGGLVIDLRDLKAIDLDEGTKTVWAETGLTAEELTRSVTAKNL